MQLQHCSNSYLYNCRAIINFVNILLEQGIFPDAVNIAMMVPVFKAVIQR